MALYSAEQLLDKTLLLNKTVDLYNVLDINNSGDQAKPVFTLTAGHTFVLDSFLLPTEGYTNAYGIHYAKRDFLYFLFFNLAGDYMAVRVRPGIFSLKALQDQGALTVKEELDAAKRENMGWLEKLIYDLTHGPLKTVAIVGLVIFGAGYLISKSKKRTNG